MAESAHPSRAPAGGPDLLANLELSLEAFPHLAAAIAREGDGLRGELIEFAMAARWKRAPRIKRGLIARVHFDDDVPEVAVVRDISTSGVRVWVDRGRTIDAAAGPFKMAIKVPGSREYVPVLAELVRVSGAVPVRGLELAFRFIERNDALDALVSEPG